MSLHFTMILSLKDDDEEANKQAHVPAGQDRGRLT